MSAARTTCTRGVATAALHGLHAAHDAAGGRPRSRSLYARCNQLCCTAGWPVTTRTWTDSAPAGSQRCSSVFTVRACSARQSTPYPEKVAPLPSVSDESRTNVLSCHNASAWKSVRAKLRRPWLHYSWKTPVAVLTLSGCVAGAIGTMSGCGASTAAAHHSRQTPEEAPHFASMADVFARLSGRADVCTAAAKHAADANATPQYSAAPSQHQAASAQAEANSASNTAATGDSAAQTSAALLPLHHETTNDSVASGDLATLISYLSNAPLRADDADNGAAGMPLLSPGPSLDAVAMVRCQRTSWSISTA
jgi:hypothetical protein